MNLAVSRANAAVSLRVAYLRLLRVPVRARVAVGFGGAAVAVGACTAVAGIAPAFRPTPALGLLAWVLAASVVTDLLWRRIFNWVLGPALVAVAVLHAAAIAGASTGLPSAGTSAAGLGIGFAFMLMLYVTFRGGEGDVKLVAVLGAILGPWHGVEAAMAGYLFAAGVACVLVATRLARRAVAGGSGPLLAGTLPMAPFFAAGVVFTLGA
jgi:Flp pilus assembly protein protease CpaA